MNILLTDRLPRPGAFVSNYRNLLHRVFAVFDLQGLNPDVESLTSKAAVDRYGMAVAMLHDKPTKYALPPAVCAPSVAGDVVVKPVSATPNKRLGADNPRLMAPADVAPARSHEGDVVPLNQNATI
jgi:hypothetical protein